VSSKERKAIILANVIDSELTGIDEGNVYEAPTDDQCYSLSARIRLYLHNFKIPLKNGCN